MTATWNGGTGTWTDAHWTFGTPPGVTSPNNNATNQFNARIDNSNPAASTVTLGANITVDSLQVDANETLNVNNNSFGIVRDAGRPASGQVTNAGTMNFNSSGAGAASLSLTGGNVTFSGGGKLNLAGPANTVVFSPDQDPDSMRSLSAISGSGTLTNQNHTIAGTGEIGFFDMGIKNLTGGVIDANVSGAALVVAGKDLTSPSGVGVTNLGTMQASNGGILRLFSGTYQQTDGVNQGTILAKAGSTVQIENSGANINGGSLKSESGGAILMREVAVNLTGTAVNNAGAMTLVDGNAFGSNVPSTLSLDAASSFTNSGTVDITHSSLSLASTPVTNSGVMSVTSTANGAASITITGAVTFDGGGKLNLAGPANTVVFSPDQDPDTTRSLSAISGTGTLTNQNHTIAGTGEIGFFDMGIKNLTGGVIDANVAGAALVVAGKDLASSSGVGATNLGTMQASNGGILRLFSGTYQQTDGANQGTILAKAGSTVQIENSGANINGGSLKSESTGAILMREAAVILTGTAVNNAGAMTLVDGNAFGSSAPSSMGLDAASSFTNSGTVDIIHSSLSLASAPVTNSGVMSVTSTANGAASITITGAVTFDGGGTLNLKGQADTVVFSPDADPDTKRALTNISGTGTLTNQNHTIAGTGEIGFFDMGIKNLAGGVIDANVSGAALVVAGKDLTSPSGVGATNLGTMQASNGGILRLFSGTYQQTDGVNQGTILAKAGSMVQIENSGANINGGSLKSESGGAVLMREVAVNLTGTAVNNAGTLTLIDGNAFGSSVPSTLSLDAASSFTNGGTVEITNSFFTTAGAFVQTVGNTKLTNGTITAHGGVDIQGGKLSGTGTIHGNVQNAGTVAPGNSPGLLTIDGNYKQTVVGVLDIELGGLDVNSFDRVTVMNDADLAGTLKVTLINGFDLLSDEFFDILLTGGLLNGTFDLLDLPNSPEGLWEVSYLRDRVRLSFDFQGVADVPEPPAILVFICGLVFLVMRAQPVRGMKLSSRH